MRSRLSAIFLLVLLFSSCQPEHTPEVTDSPPKAESIHAVTDPGQQAESVRVVTWNIEWFPGKSPRNAEADLFRDEHIQGVQEALVEIAPDILLLQEMRNLEAVEAAVALLDHDVHMVSRFRQGAAIGRLQLAITSTFEADSAFAQDFEAGPGDPPRGFVFAALDIGLEKPLLAYTVHLKSNAGGNVERNIASREESSRQIVAHVETMMENYPDSPVIVGGDFNFLEYGPYVEEQSIPIFEEAGFSWTWSGIPLEQRVTWPSNGRYPDACFDGFFVRGIEVGSLTVDDRWDEWSDHRPVVLEVVLTDPVED